MPLYEVTTDAILPIAPSTFREAQIQERSDLQRLLRDRIDVIAKDCLVLAEEFGDWDDSRRRIDLLALDAQANLVVIELKRSGRRFSVSSSTSATKASTRRRFRRQSASASQTRSGQSQASMATRMSLLMRLPERARSVARSLTLGAGTPATMNASNTTE